MKGERNMSKKAMTHFEIIERTEILYRNVRREGLTLKATEVASTYAIRNEVYDETGAVKKQISKSLKEETEEKNLEIQLREISKAEISKLWEMKIPSFILKKDGKYFQGVIPRAMTFLSSNVIEKPHACSKGINPGACCRRMDSAPDPDGCEKVRNCARHIEIYDWITYGYEAICTAHPAFVVGECEHYEMSPLRKGQKKGKK